MLSWKMQARAARTPLVAPGLLFIVWLLAASTVAAEERFSFAATPGKLPKDVVPLSYAIRIQPDVATLTTKGSARIEIEVRKPTDEIVLNANELEINRAVLEASQPVSLSVSYQRIKQLATLSLPEALQPGRYTLRLDFTGRILASPSGLHFVKYSTPRGQKTMLATQMEPVAARRMFPCWDEPVFRARFHLTAVVPQDQTALSNTPIMREQVIDGGAKEVEFERTPEMSTYLVALVVGDFEALKDRVDGTDLNIFTTEGKRDSARYAMEATKKVLPYFKEYFGTGYVLPKLDQIALPGSISGAMENWGAITYNESLLLYDAATSSPQTKQTIFRIAAHEIAHQWFGNLVTMAWWDNVWLKEGFAEWISRKASDRFHPEWGVWLRTHHYTERALHRDARRSTHPIQQPVTNEVQVIDAFDEITYGKSQAFLRMLEQYLGEEELRRGLARYIATHRYSNTTTADLWSALEQLARKPVRAVAAGWTEQPGFPLVKVSGNCVEGKHRIWLQQERFAFDRSGDASFLWKIPIVLGDGQSPEQLVLLEDESGTFDYGDCAGVLRVNAGAVGYFRVQYEQPLFDRLRANIEQIPTADRMKLLSDTWALVEAGRLPSTAYLDLVEALKHEKSFHVWEQILDTLILIDQLEQGEPGRTAFRAYARTLLAPELKRLGWSSQATENDDTTQLRSRIIEFLGRFGDENVLREANRRFEMFLERPDSLAADLRDPVLATVGRYATLPTYERLSALAKRAQSMEDKRRYYRAMQLAAAPALAQRTLDLSLGDEMPVLEAYRNPATITKEGEHADLVWEFVQRNLDRLLERFDPGRRNYYVPGIMAASSDAAHADELEAFARTNLPSVARYIAARTAEAIRHRALVKRRELPAVDSWVKGHN